MAEISDLTEASERVEVMLEGLLDRDNRGARVMSADSRAMFELSQELQWVTDDCEEPLSAARQIGHVSLVAARDFVWAASESASGRSKLGMFPLARSAIEASERAYYLLAPELSLLERVRRGVTERASTLKEQHLLLKATSEVNPRAGEALEKYVALRQRVARYADSKGFLPEKRSWSRYPLPVDRGGTVTDRVQDFLAAADAGWTLRGAFVYKQLCATTHANSAYIEILGTKVQNPPSGLPSRKFDVAVEEKVRSLVVAIRALHQAESAYFEFHGWESPDDLIFPVASDLLDLL